MYWSGHRSKASERGDSLSGAHRGRDKSGHGTKAGKRGMLTLRKAQREGSAMTRKASKRVSRRGALTPWRAVRQVRTTTESDRANDTNILDNTEGQVRTQNNKVNERGAFTLWRPQRGGRSGRIKRASEGGTLTLWKT